MDINKNFSRETAAEKATEFAPINVTSEMIEAINKIAGKKGHLSKEDEYHLIECFKVSGPTYLGAEEMYAKQYESIVKICKQFAANHQRRENVDDYIQSSFIYMLEALDTFKFSKGTRFNTHLTTIIKKCLNDDYYKENGISKYYQQEYYKIGKFKESYERDHGYQPTDYEIKRSLGYTEARYTAILREALALNPIYMDSIGVALKNETRDSEYLCTDDVLGRNRALQVVSPEEIMMKKERDEAIARVYIELGPVKTEILQRYTGSDYDQPQSKSQIISEMGLSKYQVNKMLAEALDYAKDHLRVYYY